MKILLVEDNNILSKNIKEYLKIKWISVEHELYWDRAYDLALKNHYDVIDLDINLPWKDWLSILKDLRANHINTPVIMLTSRNTTDDIIEWLKTWADDYMWKPFSLEELVFRLEAIYRRTAQDKQNLIEINWLEIDIEKRKVIKDWNIIDLSKLEFDLLKYLVQNRGKPIDRAELFEKVWWDFDEHMLSRTVDVYISYLRKKLGNDFIETKKWYGYLVN